MTEQEETQYQLTAITALICTVLFAIALCATVRIYSESELELKKHILKLEVELDYIKRGKK